MNRIALYAFAALALATGAGCVNRTAIAQSERTRQIIADPNIPVVVKDLFPQLVEDTIEVTGSIAADGDTQVGALVPGKVVAVFVKEGDTVSVGQVIARQEDTDAQNRLRQAMAGEAAARSQLQQARTEAAAGPQRSSAAVRAAEARVRQAEETIAKLKAGSRDQEKKQADIQVDRAKSDLDTAKKAVDRSRRLFGEGAISKSDLEGVENRYDNAMAAYQAALETRSLVQDPIRREDIRIAEQELAAAREGVRIEKTNKSTDSNFQERVRSAEANLRLNQEQVRLAQKAVSDAVIRAPISGRISGRPIQPGVVLAPGIPVARIVALDGLYFEPEVTEAQAPKVRPGTNVTVRVDALGEVTTQGVVRSIDPQASSVGRLFKARVILQNPPELMKAGMFAKGQILIGRTEGVYLVPDQAVLRDGDRAWVMVAEDGKAVRRPLMVKAIKGATVQATGLKPGDKVIVQGQVGLLEGASVKIEAPGAKTKP